MRHWRAHGALRGAPLNFEPCALDPYTPHRGWHADALSQRLPGESPGDPTPGGSWQVARRLMQDFRTVDPAIVGVTWDPYAPLQGREMLLELRLYRVISRRDRLALGVRVMRVWDEERVQAGRCARVFGFEHATLRGHVEMGCMDYELSSGATTERSSSTCALIRSLRSTARPGSVSAFASLVAASSCASIGAAASGWLGSRPSSSGCP
jgi:Domain of unknown function (DUF1990)